ncbi:lipoprotein [Spiroplasma citri]|uniref:Lipoprotein n=1 Tax=Spiroplasma citri TaxID=2133 RepID=A0AAX3SX49_SPICI|nr:lipoprotein [Spiroplasma citri]WFG95733.1 lipoprotein [Spiroplasma citri]WFG99618.1 lipoprotein [Spiroplasma citri]
MKKLLSFLGAITLLGTSTTSLVACNNIPQYNEDELQQLKKENQIYTNFQEIKEKLEWICPQEKPFNTVDNKYYFVVWRGDKNDVWEIVKFKNDTKLEDKKDKKIDFKSDYGLFLYKAPYFSVDLIINKINNPVSIVQWQEYIKNKNYFKAVYRWNGDEQKLPDLIVDNNGNVKVNSE